MDNLSKLEPGNCIECKACKTKVKVKSLITHLSRLTNCRAVYGSEFDEMKAEKDKERKEYLVTYKKSYNKKNATKIKKKQRKYDAKKKCQKVGISSNEIKRKNDNDDKNDILWILQ